MFFGLGGHPGFRVPLEEGLAFEDYRVELSPEAGPVQVGFTPQHFLNGQDRPFPLDTPPQEYSTCGVGAFRRPSIEFELPCGSRTADLRYARGQIRRGKYALEGLPAFLEGGGGGGGLNGELRGGPAPAGGGAVFGGRGE